MFDNEDNEMKSIQELLEKQEIQKVYIHSSKIDDLIR